MNESKVKPSDEQVSPTWSTSTDPNFYEYYSRESTKPETIARFERLADAVLAALPDNKTEESLKVADIGGGAGTLSIVMARKGHLPCSIDLSSDLQQLGARRAKEEELEIEFKNCSATDLPFPNDSFDICFVPELLEHVKDWQSCVNEAVRVLKPGGALYLSTTNKLCPRQMEFNLPAYSWYPGWLKRYFLRRAMTDKPEISNFAQYPAFHWFTVYGLIKYMRKLGMDRFLLRPDMMLLRHNTGLKRIVVRTICFFPPLRLAIQFITAGSVLVCFKSIGELDKRSSL